ncbi:disintegrin and metalloproteinase domain-containing protein 10-like [Ornithodoros turicata]
MCHFPNMREHCGIRMMPGSPCNEMRGYCDVFQKCRLVDAEGPISRLESILKSEPARSVTNLISDHIIISIIVLVGIVGTLLVCFRLCEVHAPTSSPTQRPVLPLKDTLKHLNPHEALEGAPPDAQRSPQASGDNQVNQ